MILPEGNSKKYIKVVIGIYVLFTIISPVITKFTGKSITVSNMLSLNEYAEAAEKSAKIQDTIKESNTNNILNIYSENIKNDIVAKIQAKGYETNHIEVEIADDESYNILSIKIDISKKNENVENEKIQTDNIKSNETNNSNIDLVDNVNRIEVNIGKEEKAESNISNQNKDNSERIERRRKVIK